MRSKEIFKAARGEILRMTLTGEDGNLTVYRDADGWTSADENFEADSDKIVSAISYLDPMRCTDFLDSAPRAEPAWVLSVETNDGNSSIEIWPKEGDRYPARSSQNGYPVLITTYVAENLLKAFGVAFSE